MGGPGPIGFPTSSHPRQSGGEIALLPLHENQFDFSVVAQHALGLGSSGHVQPNTIEPVQPTDTTIQ